MLVVNYCLYPDKIYEIVKGDRGQCNKTGNSKDYEVVLIREHINAVEVAQLIEKAGASAIAIHGRTRSQMYEGHS